MLDDATVRCWGFGGNGRLGYGNTTEVGDDEAPGSVGPVDVGVGRTVTQITAGDFHTCALLDDATVRCWGWGGNGRLGYGNTTNVGDDEVPGSVGPVDVGVGRTAVQIAAGDSHTCALLDEATVRCWGNGSFGQLGYGNTDSIGDDEAPGSVGPVDVGEATVPGAPTDVAVSGTDGGAEVSWAAPASDGGSPVMAYRVFRDGVQVHETADGTTLSFTDSGLSNGTEYDYEVAAVNFAGEGAKSSVVSATPRTVPGVPTGVAVSPTDSGADVTWAAPASDGGSPVSA